MKLCDELGLPSLENVLGIMVVAFGILFSNNLILREDEMNSVQSDGQLYNGGL